MTDRKKDTVTSMQFDRLTQTAQQALQHNNITLATQCVNEILKADARHAQANFIAGIISFQNDMASQAITHLQKAIKSDANNPNIHNSLGSMLLSVKKLQGAQKHFKKAAELNPNFDGAYNNLGVTYKQQGRLQDARKAYQKAVSINPNYGDALNNLGILLQDMGEFDKAIICFRQAIASKQCTSNANSNLLLTLNYKPDISAHEIFEEHFKWGSQLCRTISPTNSQLIEKKGKKPLLKIAYLSADFRQHSVAHFFKPLLAAHNQEKYQIYCYYNNKKEDHVSQQIKDLCFQWRNIASTPDAAVVKQIMDDDIDILVDLSGHTGKNRLNIFASRAAPIQITWLGYPNTTGLPTMDYRFTDEEADPTECSDKYYTEKLIRLACGFLSFEGDQKIPVNDALPALKKNHITFGSFNNLTKVTPNVIQTWSRILTVLPDARLILKSTRLDSKETQERIHKAFLKHGVSPKRVKLYGNIKSNTEHLKLYSQIDIGLDPYPYHGTTTSCEALWMGIPFISLSGVTHASRVGKSLLTRVELTEFIAHNEEQYIQTAIHFSNHLEELQKIRSSLRLRMINSDLCNATLFAQQVEQALERVWNTAHANI